jgi:gliding motility-associated-like protein
LAASVAGEVDGYTFRWYDGKAIGTKINNVGERYTGLDEGFFTSTAVENISGCVSKPTTAEVKTILILPDFDVKTKPTNCEQNIGEAMFVQMSDTPIASIEWDLVGSTETWQGSILSGLPKGMFNVTVTSEKQCVLTKIIQILPEILVFNGVSSNNDGQNEVFEIACIQDFPNNNVQIFNRQGTIVYEVDGYNNVDVAFKGISNKGVSFLGTELPVGTYFYIINKRDGSQPRSGYLELLR